MGTHDVDGRAPAHGLGWLGALLFAGSVPEETIVVADAPPEGYRSVFAFRALPNARHPYLLMPLDSRATAAGSVHHIGNPLKRRMRVAESALSLSFQMGVGQRVLNQRLHVCVPQAAEIEAPTLIDRAIGVVGRTDVSTAVILGRDRPNRKPVLKLLAPDGVPVAFAKVGWNDVSRDLVRHEAEVLAAMGTEGRRPSSFRVPSVIGYDPGDRVDLLVVTPIPQASGLRGGPPPMSRCALPTRWPWVTGCRGTRWPPARTGRPCSSVSTSPRAMPATPSAPRRPRRSSGSLPGTEPGTSPSAPGTGIGPPGT